MARGCSIAGVRVRTRLLVESIVLWVTVLAVLADALQVSLPGQFHVTVGTTIPFETIEPVAQSGSMYVDSAQQRFRVDSFWMDASRSIVVDMKRGSCFVIQNGECKYVTIATGSRRDTRNQFGVPDGFIRHAELYNVRGVAVQRYSGVERGDYLQEVDYYVRNLTYVDPRIIPEHSDEPVPILQFPVLWRIETRRSRRKEIGSPMGANPNWRFFGQPMNELVTLDEPFSTAVEQLVNDVPVTVDFFNFVPETPDPNVFSTPSTCEELSGELDRDVDVFSAQRLLIDLSFHSVHGRRVMESVMGRRHSSRAARTADDGESEDL